MAANPSCALSFGVFSIVSDEIGPAWGYSWDHAPWDGLHFADFVFPAFVFIVGMAVPLSTGKNFASDRWGATKKAIVRSVKMFAVGFLAATGGFPDTETPTFYRLAAIRIPGILQRIAFVYLVTVLIHVWIPLRRSEPRALDSAFRSGLRLYEKYLFQWLAMLAIVALWLGLTFGTGGKGFSGGGEDGVEDCSVYGKLDPPCSASRFWDRLILGDAHMYRSPTLRRSHWCSLASPDDLPRPFSMKPQWCDRPFDPEGILGSLTACATGFFGLWFGQVLANVSEHKNRIQHWISLSGVCMVLGLILHFVPGAMPMNKNLWSLSYVLVMVGVDGAVFSIFYTLVDARASVTSSSSSSSSTPPRFTLRWFLFPLLCMGMNAILVFVVAQSDISLETGIRWFYWDTMEQNLVKSGHTRTRTAGGFLGQREREREGKRSGRNEQLIRRSLLSFLLPCFVCLFFCFFCLQYHWYRVNFLQRYLGLSWGVFTWALTKVACWLAISVWLAKKKIFWKL